MTEINLIDQILSPAARTELGQIETRIDKLVGTLDKATLSIGTGTGSNDIMTATNALKKLAEEEEKRKKVHQDAIIIAAQRRKAEAEALLIEEKLAQTTERNTAAKQKQTREEKLNALANNEAAGYKERLNAQYEIEILKITRLTEAEFKNIQIGGKMIQNAAAMQAELLKIEQSYGRSTRNVGNYAGSFRSVSILASELPNLGISMRTFVMSISNNIGMVVQDFKNLANSIDETGQKVGKAKAWKAILATAFGPMTWIYLAVALMPKAIELLSKWIDKIKQQGKETQATVTAIKEYQNVRRDGIKDAQTELTHLTLLYRQSQSNRLELSQKIRAVDEMQSKYPKYFGNLSDEAILAGEAAGKYKELSFAILQNAMARASEEKLAENSRKILDLMYKRTDAHEQLVAKTKDLTKAEAEAGGSAFTASEGLYGGTSKSVIDLSKKIKGFNDVITDSDKKISALRQENNMLADSIGKTGMALDDLDGKDGGGMDDAADKINYLSERSKAWIEVLRDSAKQSNTSADAYASLSTAIENIDYETSTNKLKDELAKQKIEYVKNKKDTTILIKNYNTNSEKLELEHTAKLELIEKERLDNYSDNAASREKKQKESDKKILDNHDKFVKEMIKGVDDFNKSYSDGLKKLNSDTEKYLDDNRQMQKQIIRSGYDAIMSFVEGFTNRYLDKLEERGEKEQESQDAKMKDLEGSYNAGLMSKKEYENRKDALDAESLAKQKSIQEEQAKIERNTFLMKQGLAAAGIMIEAYKQNAYYNSAIAAAVMTYGAASAPFVAALTALKTSTWVEAGLAAAAALAQTIPYFAQGGTMSHDGMAMVGDGGKHEVMKTPTGDLFLTPSVPTLVKMDKGTIIYPDAEKYSKTVHNETNVQNMVDMREVNRNLKTLIAVSGGKQRISLHEQSKIQKRLN